MLARTCRARSSICTPDSSDTKIMLAGTRFPLRSAEAIPPDPHGAIRLQRWLTFYAEAGEVLGDGLQLARAA